MKAVLDIRDLLSFTPPVDPGRTPAEDKAGVALPGDPVEAVDNPFLGKNPQHVLRLLRSGTLSADQERQARDAVSIFEGISKENLTGGPERAVPVPNLRGSREAPAPSRPIDEDVLQNPDFDPDLSDLFR